MGDADAARIGRRALVVAVVLALALAAGAMWARRPRLEAIEIGQQTTYITSPTRADGWVDYPEAVDWMRRASLDAGGANAAPPLVRALGPNLLLPSADRDTLLKRIGIDAGSTAALLTPLRAFKAQVGSRYSAPSPETLEWFQARCRAGKTIIRTSAWLGQLQAAFSELHAAARAASLYVPVSREPGAARGFARVDVKRLSDGMDAMACWAAIRMLEGDVATSWSETESLWTLGLMVARSASGTEYAGGAGFWKAAVVATVDLAASPRTSPETLAAMEARIAALAFPPATEALMIDRLALLDAVGTPRVVKAADGATTVRAGTVALLESINRHFDALEAALRATNARERSAAVARIDAAAPAIAGLERSVGRDLLAVELRASSYQRLARVAVALALRQRAQGALPSSLAELGQLGDVARDPASGDTFHYIVTGRQFRLYGAGEDGQDDSGAANKDITVDGQEPPRLEVR